MKENSNFIQSLCYILKKHLSSDEKLRTVSIILDTELKKKLAPGSSHQIPVVFSKVSAEGSALNVGEFVDETLNNSVQEPHPANLVVNGMPLKTIYLNEQDPHKPVSNLRAEWEPKFDGILSVREKEIIDTLAQGYNHKMIADKLGISINTVRNHFRRIHFKLSVHSNTQVLLKVYKTGIFKTKLLLFLFYSAVSSLVYDGSQMVSQGSVL